VAYFGFGKGFRQKSEVLDDTELPSSLIEAWAKNEGAEAQFFPSVCVPLSLTLLNSSFIVVTVFGADDNLRRRMND
jgi:hypothetical protein